MIWAAMVGGFIGAVLGTATSSLVAAYIVNVNNERRISAASSQMRDYLKSLSGPIETESN